MLLVRNNVIPYRRKKTVRSSHTLGAAYAALPQLGVRGYRQSLRVRACLDLQEIVAFVKRTFTNRQVIAWLQIACPFFLVLEILRKTIFANLLLNNVCRANLPLGAEML